MLLNIHFFTTRLTRRSFWFRSLLASLIGGVALGVFRGTPSFFIFYCGMLAVCVGVILFWKYRIIRWGLFVCLFFFLGLFRVGDSHLSIDTRVDIHEKDVISFHGLVAREPSFKNKSQRIPMHISSYRTEDGMPHAYKGELLVISRLYPVYAQDDILSVQCRVSFSQTKKIVCFTLSLQRIGQKKGNKVLANIVQFRSWLSQRLHEVLSTEVAGFIIGILYGSQAGVSQEMHDAFVKTGTSHLLAVSGYNIALVVVACLFVLRTLHLSRKKSVGILLFCIVLFTIFTGSSPATIRACVMGGVVLIAQMFGRQRSGIFALLITGAGMTLLDPQLLLFNHSFYLSFLATLGIVVGMRQAHSPEFKKTSSKFFRELFSQTFLATLFTAPYIFYFFGNISLVSIVVNIFIVPLIPFCMALGFMLSICIVFQTIFFHHLSFIVFLIAGIVESVTRIVLGSIFWFSHLPYASLSFPQSSWTGVCVYGIYLALGVWIGRRHSVFIQKYKEEIGKF